MHRRRKGSTIVTCCRVAHAPRPIFPNIYIQVISQRLERRDRQTSVLHAPWADGDGGRYNDSTVPAAHYAFTSSAAGAAAAAHMAVTSRGDKSSARKEPPPAWDTSFCSPAVLAEQERTAKNRRLRAMANNGAHLTVADKIERFRPITAGIVIAPACEARQLHDLAMTRLPGYHKVVHPEMTWRIRIWLSND